MYPIGSNVIHRDLSDTAVIERKVNHNNYYNYHCYYYHYRYVC